MQIVLLVDLPFNGSIHTKLDHKGIVLSSGRSIFVICMLKDFLELLDLAPRSLLLLVDGVLEVATETLDLLDLLTKVTSQPGQCPNYIVLDVARLVCLRQGALVELVKNACGITQAIFAHEDGGMCDVRYRTLDLVHSLGAHLIAGLNLAKVRNKTFQKLSPCLKPICQNFGRRALRGYRCRRI